MPGTHGTFADVIDVLAVLVLLSEFAMLRAALSRSQVRLYAIQSLVVAGLAAYAGAERHVVGLWAVAIVSLLLKVILIPAILLRLLRDAQLELVPSHRLGVASMVLIGLGLALLGLFLAGHLAIPSRILPTETLGIALAAILVSFGLLILRSDVVSQAVGFFSLENAVSLASLAVAAGLPLTVELAFFFDLLVAVVAIAILVGVHRRRHQTLSTAGLDRLRG